VPSLQVLAHANYITLVESPDIRRETTTRRALAERMLSDANFLDQVVGIWKSRPGTNDARKYTYILIATSGTGLSALWLDSESVTLIAVHTCSGAPSEQISDLNRTNDVILAPPP